MVDKKKDTTTEAKILEAARKVFIAKGMAGARMQDIADEAGINKAMLHYYFRSKDQLFETIFKESVGNLIPRVKALLNADLPLFTKIEMFADNYISMAMQNPYIPMFVMNEVNRQPQAFIKKMFGNDPPDLSKLVEQIEQEVKKKNIVPISPVQLVMNLMSLCVFPFLGKPILSMVIGLDELQFKNIMEQRKKAVPEFIIASIKK